MANHILIVDDDELMRRSLGLHLEQAGYRCSTAASAEDALALARLDSPDLILLDIGLPGMDGLQALKQFQSGRIILLHPSGELLRALFEMSLSK
jgi:DNA-binding response OmpR family regulator